jgi:hypothetical protein
MALPPKIGGVPRGFRFGAPLRRAGGPVNGQPAGEPGIIAGMPLPPDTMGIFITILDSKIWTRRLKTVKCWLSGSQNNQI